MRRMSARVSAERLAAGDLPPICVVTGRPADTRVAMTFRSTPDWTWLLLLAAGQLPILAWLGLAAWLLAGASLIVVNLWWVGAVPHRQRGDVVRRVHPRFAQELRNARPPAGRLPDREVAEPQRCSSSPSRYPSPAARTPASTDSAR